MVDESAAFVAALREVGWEQRIADFGVVLRADAVDLSCPGWLCSAERAADAPPAIRRVVPDGESVAEPTTNQSAG